MESKIFKNVDPGILFLILLAIVVILIIYVLRLHLSFRRLRRSYLFFMRGNDGKNLEELFKAKFNEVDTIVKVVKQNKQDIRTLMVRNANNYQKLGIIKYDAFNEMGGKLSFALAMLDEKDNGWIINAMHSREGCYTYIKEIVKGRSYAELAEEEAQALDKAIYSVNYEANTDSEEK
ncbi:hypothetical protein M2150_001896 [Lachnospiraceae bacterium PM6-15]|uniref:DUF4446 family protein n=1 Tax=Ohessyouella blattaphilus TaxID=2949333 RepID=UPI003E28C5A7